MGSKNYPKALEDCNKALELNLGDASSIFIQRALIYRNNDNYEYAIDDANKAVELAPYSADSYLGRANIQRDYEKALLDCDTAVKLEPNCVDAYWQRARLYNDYGKAMQECNKVIELEPYAAESYLVKADISFSHKQFENAIAAYNQALELDPDFTYIYFLRGKCYSKMGAHDKAVADALKAVECKIDEHTLRGYAKEFFDEKNYSEAIFYCTKELERHPNDTETLLHRGDAYRFAEDYAKALMDYTEVIKQPGKEKQKATAYFGRAWIYSNQNDYINAIENYTKTIGLRPNNAGVYNNRGLCYKAQGDYEKAVADFTKAIERAPDNDLYYKNRGDLYRDQGDYASAVADFTKAIEIKPKSAFYYNKRGECHELLGNTAQAAADFAKANELSQR